MAIEARRGCGYRKAGGIYIRGDLSNAVPAAFLPFCIDYNFARGITWADSERLFATCADPEAGGYRKFGRLGLLWVGETHYKTPADFVNEAHDMGVSRRVAFLPKDLKAGDPIAAAHIRAIPTRICNHAPINGALVSDCCPACELTPVAKAISNGLRKLTKVKGETVEGVAGVFTLFIARNIEVVLPESVAQDPDIQLKCAANNVDIVTVPDHDKDHVPADWKLPTFLRDENYEDEVTEETAEQPASAGAELA